jgi:hypothetical protein
MIRHHRAPEPPPISSTFHYGGDIILILEIEGLKQADKVGEERLKLLKSIQCRTARRIFRPVRPSKIKTLELTP